MYKCWVGMVFKMEIILKELRPNEISLDTKQKKEAKRAKADASEQIIDRSVLVFNENVCT